MTIRLRMPTYAPTNAAIGARAVWIINIKHRIFYGWIVMGAVALGLIAAKQPFALWSAPAIVALILGALFARWSFRCNLIRDALIPDYLLTDSVDLRWMDWVAEYEPRIAAVLAKRRPDRQYRSSDFQAALWRLAYAWQDRPRLPPYFGDSERSLDDLETRQTKERRLRA